MQSKLELKSEPNKGSEFSFILELPYSNESVETFNAIDNDSIVHHKNSVVSTENKIIFIVEDNKINMLLAKTLVKQIMPNAIIFELANGKEALEKTHELVPDLILMDIQMPVMNGYDSTLEIRKIPNTEKIPIIALTAGTIIGEKNKCIENGMNDYIAKPIDKVQLIKIISLWINNK
jgi:CheY-like chemotaxis protein